MELPTRTCVACRRREPKDQLLRFVAVGNTIAVDRSASRPGRGAYVCHRSRCCVMLEEQGAAMFRRALRRRDLELAEGAVTVARAMAAVQAEG